MHCGKFQDALEPLLSWLADTEELIANQKPPSAEYKVVKAQIQEQKVSENVETVNCNSRREWQTTHLLIVEGAWSGVLVKSSHTLCDPEKKVGIYFYHLTLMY